MPRDADIVAPRGRLVRGLLTLYGVAMYLFLFVPIVVLVLLSFNTSRTVGFPLKHLTLKWYRVLPDDVLIKLRDNLPRRQLVETHALFDLA